MNSRVFEDLPDELKVEFKRKVRIGTGNFQNLRKFWRLIFTKRYGFAFLSHKVIRWFGPFFLLAAFLLNIYLAPANPFFQLVLAGHLMFYFIALDGFRLQKAWISPCAVSPGDTFYIHECRAVHRLFQIHEEGEERCLGAHQPAIRLISCLSRKVSIISKSSPCQTLCSTHRCPSGGNPSWPCRSGKCPSGRRTMDDSHIPTETSKAPVREDFSPIMEMM